MGQLCVATTEPCERLREDYKVLGKMFHASVQLTFSNLGFLNLDTDTEQPEANGNQNGRCYYQWELQVLGPSENQDTNVGTYL